jgi:lipid-A-disaccharide synthase-like uncharacterized protein
MAENLHPKKSQSELDEHRARWLKFGCFGIAIFGAILWLVAWLYFDPKIDDLAQQRRMLIESIGKEQQAIEQLQDKRQARYEELRKELDTLKSPEPTIESIGRIRKTITEMNQQIDESDSMLLGDGDAAYRDASRVLELNHQKNEFEMRQGWMKFWGLALIGGAALLLRFVSTYRDRARS